MSFHSGISALQQETDLKVGMHFFALLGLLDGFHHQPSIYSVDSAPQDPTRTLSHQTNGWCSSEAITASPNPKFTFSGDDTAGAESSAIFLQHFNDMLLQVFGPPQVYSLVADCYSTFAQAVVPAFLVCAQIL